MKTWFHDNQTLVYFLIAQAVAISTTGVSLIAYMVKLETRVAILEVRGSPHLAEINTRLTVLEGSTQDNKQRLDKMAEIMTKGNLTINPQKDK